MESLRLLVRNNGGGVLDNHVNGHVLRVATPFRSAAIARVVGQDVAHRPGRDPEKMDPRARADVFSARELEVCLVDQGSSVYGGIAAPPRALPSRGFSELVVNNGKQCFHCSAIAALEVGEQARDRSGRR